MRYSRQRHIISNIVHGTTRHPDADWVYKEARKVMSNISLGTVYRNLKLLSEMGEIIALETDNGVLRYDGDISQHSHFLCKYCHVIHDIEIVNLPIDELKKKNYSIESCKLMFYGRCPSCSGIRTEGENA